MDARPWTFFFRSPVGRGGTRALGLALACALGACGGSGGGDTSTPIVIPAGNITFDSPSPTHAGQVHAGQVLDVQFALIAETDKVNVGVTADIVPIDVATQTPADVDPGDPGYVDQAFGIGGGVFDVPAGHLDLELHIEVPDDTPPGTYALVLHLDRTDTTPDDDLLQTETEAQRADNAFVSPVVLTVTGPTAPNLRIVECGPAAPVIDSLLHEGLETPGGTFLLVPFSVEVEAQSLTVPAGTELTVEVEDPSNPGTWVAASITSVLSPGFVLGAFVLPELRVGDPPPEEDVTDLNRESNRHGVSFDILVPQNLVEPMLSLGTDVALQIRVTLDPGDVVPEQDETPGVLQADNVCVTQLMVLAPSVGVPLQAPPGTALVAPSDLRNLLWSGAAPKPLPASDSSGGVLQTARQTSSSYGNSQFACATAFGTGLSWQNAAQSQSAGAPPDWSLFSGYGQVDLTLFGSKKRILDVRGGALASACHLVLQYGFEARFAGLTLYEDYTSIDLNLVPGIPLSKTFKFDKKLSQKWFLMLGPVPVQIEAGAQGSIGIGVSFQRSAGPTIAVGVGPVAALGGFASASVNLAAVSVGVTAEIDVLKVTLMCNASLTFPCGGPVQFDLSVPWTVSTLDGKIFVWVKYPAPTWKNLGKKKTLPFTIVEWNGFTLASGTLWRFSHSW